MKEDDEKSPLKLLEEDGDESVAEGEGLPQEDEDHDEHEAGDDDLDGLSEGGGTRK